MLRRLWEERPGSHYRFYARETKLNGRRCSGKARKLFESHWIYVIKSNMHQEDDEHTHDLQQVAGRLAGASPDVTRYLGHSLGSENRGASKKYAVSIESIRLVGKEIVTRLDSPASEADFVALIGDSFRRPAMAETLIDRVKPRTWSEVICGLLRAFGRCATSAQECSLLRW